MLTNKSKCPSLYSIDLWYNLHHFYEQKCLYIYYSDSNKENPMKLWEIVLVFMWSNTGWVHSCCVLTSAQWARSFFAYVDRWVSIFLASYQWYGKRYSGLVNWTSNVVTSLKVDSFLFIFKIIFKTLADHLSHFLVE